MRVFSARLRFSRDHRWAPDQMSGYLDEELSIGDRRRMEEHLAECAECRRLIASLGLVVTALHGLRSERGPDPAQVAAAVRGRLTGESAAGPLG